MSTVLNYSIIITNKEMIIWQMFLIKKLKYFLRA